MLRLTSPPALELRRAMRAAAASAIHADADAAATTSAGSETDEFDDSRPPSAEPRGLHTRTHTSSVPSSRVPSRAGTPNVEGHENALADAEAEHKKIEAETMIVHLPAPGPDPVDPAASLPPEPPSSPVIIPAAVVPDLDEAPSIRPARANRNMHLGGLLVFACTLAAESYWCYQWFGARPVDGWFPLYLMGAVAILFYSTFLVTIIAHSVFNALTPVSWIHENSAFYSHTPAALPWAHRWRRRASMESTRHTRTSSGSTAGLATPGLATPGLATPGLSTPVVVDGAHGTPEPSSASSSRGQIVPRSVMAPIARERRLPRVCAQMPVYTEDFDQTIRPSIESTLLAGRTYVKSYRTATFGFLINEDGLQTLSPEMRKTRIEFYEQQPDLCYIARAVQGRAGRFKKASNMNFCLRWLKRALVHSKMHGISLDQSLKILGAQHSFIAGAGPLFCAETVLEEPLGAYMLLLDSDSRMSAHAIFPLVSELELDPSLGFLQAFTRPRLVVHDFFETLIGAFTERLFSIAFMFACSNGAPAPLIGHNALLRCHACEKVAWYDEQGVQMFWAEDKVSEDFDLYMRLCAAGYTGRYIGFDLGFTEGVSLTIVEEMSRWSKYSFGVNELMFNPLWQWKKQGVLSSTFVNFITSDISWYAKFGSLSYMGSFYAMAVGPPVTLLNYFALSYSSYWQDTVGTSARDIFLTCVAVFCILLPISNLIVMWRFKLAKRGVWRMIWDEIPYSIFMGVLFSGMPYHIFLALIHHFFSIPISWTTTTKEGHISTRWEELKSTFRQMRVMYISAIITIAMIAAMYWLPPHPWRIHDWQAVVPLLYFCVSHMLCPLLLNPIIMRGPLKSPEPSGTPGPAPVNSKGVTVV